MTAVEIKTHTELLNYIAEKIGAKHYLEIGVFDVNHNFNKVKVRFKEGVDPSVRDSRVAQMPSDEFFSGYKIARYDLVLIDGLHHSDQARNDLVNAWQCLNENGVIVLHDTNPPTEKTTCVPRGNQREWCGDVYKVACEISNKFTVDFDYGCTVLRKTEETIFIEMNAVKTWEYFDKNRKELLNLVSIEQAINIIDSW